MAAETNPNIGQPHTNLKRDNDRMADLAEEGLIRNTDIVVHAMDCAHSWIALQGSVWHFFGDNFQNTARLLTTMTQQASSLQERATRQQRGNH